MADFFTPLEVQQASCNFEEYEVDKYRCDPFQPTHILIESLSDHRLKIITWLKSLPLLTRVEKLMYTNKEFACLVMAMHQRLQSRGFPLCEFAISHHPERGFRLADDRFIRQPDPRILDAQNTLFASTLIGHCYTQFDSVAIAEGLAANIDKLFALFQIIENGVSHEVTSSNFSRYCYEGSPPVFCDPEEYNGCAKTLGSWLVEAIKKNVYIKYYLEKTLQPLPREIEHSLINEKMIKEKTKAFQKHWKQIAEDEKRKLYSSALSRNICHIVNSYRENIRVDDYSFPKIRYTQQQDLEGFRIQLLNQNGDSLLRSLMLTHLSLATESLPILKYELMLELEEIIDRNERSVTVKRKSTRPPSSQQSVTRSNSKKEMSILDEEETVAQSQMKPTKVIQQSRTQSNIGMVQKSDKKLLKNNSCVAEKIAQNTGQKEVYINGKKLSKKEKLKHSKITFNCRNPTLESPVAEQDEEKHEKEMQRELEVKAAQERLIKEELDKICKEIDQQSVAWAKYRQAALNRLQQILNRYGISFRVFGSHACGLALPSSDIDVCIDPTVVNYYIVSFRSYQDKIIMALEFLREALKQAAWSANFNLIASATVPVLMFEINLAIPHGDPRDLTFNLARKKQIRVQVDLTIEPYVNMIKEVSPHLGFESTNLITGWIQHEPGFAQVAILLKHLFVRNNLNKTFTGGLSSYALLTFLYTFMQITKKEGEKSTYSLLKDFSDFVASFDEISYEICLQKQGHFLRPKSLKQKKLVIRNPLNGKNLTENSSKFEQIKGLMKSLGELLRNDKQKTQKDVKKSVRGLFFN